jgi:hypothetical protein
VVACFELKQPTSLVSIAFLAISGSFQIGMDAVDYLFSLNEKVRTKDRPLARLDLVHSVYNSDGHTKLQKVPS